MARNKEIILTIYPDGHATSEGVGFEDHSCAADVRGVAEKLGQVKDETRKPEFNRPVAAHKIKAGVGR